MKPSLPHQRSLLLGVACFCLGAAGNGDLCLGAEEPKARHTFQGHASWVLSLAFSPDGKTLASGSYDQPIKLWDLATGKERATLFGHENHVSSLAFGPDGKTLASASEDTTIRLWDVATGKQRAALQGHTDSVFSVAFSPDGQTLASGNFDDTIKLWDVGTGKERATLQGHTRSVFSVVFSPDGKTLASGSNDKTIRLWDLANGKAKATLQGHEFSVWSVAFSPDGKTLASGSGDNTIKLWDPATGKERAALQGHTKPVYSVAFSPDGKTLASGSDDQTIKLWEVASGKERATLTGHTDSVFSVAFGPDGKTLASGGRDETIKLWDIPVAKQTDQRTEPTRSNTLSSEQMNGLWTTLAGEDTKKAYQAISTLVRSPQQAIALTKQRLRPVSKPNAALIQQIILLIADLDSGQFAIRQKAREELEKMGENAEAALRKKLTERPSLEVRQQIEQLLTKIEPLTPEAFRVLRSLEVLEYIGSPEAKLVLETLATGAEGARLTREAKASLDRLRKRTAIDKALGVQHP